MPKVIKAQKSFWSGFKDFITKGNALSLAIGVILGGAFQNVINSAVNDILMPFINLFTRQADAQGNLSEKFWDLTPSATDGTLVTAEAARAAGHIVITYGALVSAIINFLIIGFVAFLIVRSLTSVGDLGKKAARRKKNQPEEAPAEPTTKECPYCISEISIKATRCPHCTSELAADEEAAIDES